MVILFDGVCNLCNGFVRFIIRRDDRRLFRFGTLQSEAGKALLTPLARNEGEMTSVVLLDNGHIYSESDAVIRILSELGPVWRFCRVFSVIPRVIRNGIYKLVSRTRYGIFGRRVSCMVPTVDIQDRFI